MNKYGLPTMPFTLIVYLWSTCLTLVDRLTGQEYGSLLSYMPNMLSTRLSTCQPSTYVIDTSQDKHWRADPE